MAVGWPSIGRSKGLCSWNPPNSKSRCAWQYSIVLAIRPTTIIAITGRSLTPRRELCFLELRLDSLVFRRPAERRADEDAFDTHCRLASAVDKTEEGPLDFLYKTEMK